MLPEKIRSWRYWPAVPLAALIAIAFYGAISAQQPPSQPKHSEAVGTADQRTLHVGAPVSDAQREADATSTIATFTVVLAIVGAVQGALILWQVVLARQEFIATHRPRIRVRAIRENSIDAGAIRTALITVANVGDSKATIEAIGGEIAIRDRDTKRWTIGREGSAEGHSAPPNNVLKGGERRTYFIRSRAALFDSYYQSPGLLGDLMATGEIVYRDDNGISRRSGFAWYWADDRSDWLPAQDPLNYED